jgi:hypothetical protein
MPVFWTIESIRMLTAPLLFAVLSVKGPAGQPRVELKMVKHGYFGTM